MEVKRNIISSPNILDTDVLFVIYLGLPGNEEKTPEDFNLFLSIDSVDRRLFLDEYCDYSFEEKGEQTVLIYKRKDDSGNEISK